ncbi:arylsulfotransferase family protein [Methyloligella sp. 2.7D]|uniref:arylsulfotransferase family protein n=1 Tax=unclassified Methyloligella TaxID=2625955 RepID=UPI00157CAE07|nr:arylsulfotransferase family protein [Methyloligella sp. GL2]QKP77754.1 hypothetical protein HT051_10045 [Methyloligella sp. GL2]
MEREDQNTDSSPPAKTGTEHHTVIDRIFGWAALAGGLALAFIAGSCLTAADTFPGKQIANAYQGGKALYEQATRYADVFKTDLWYEARTAERGVVANQPDRIAPGVTLYTSGEEAKAVLLGADGEVLHEWHRPFSTVWDPARSSIKQPQPDSHVYFRKAKMFPNGDLLAIYEGSGDTPYGYGMVKLDWNSNVLWSFFGRTHHDFDVGPDGRIYVLTHGFETKKDPYFTNLAATRLLDSLAILSPDGALLDTIPLFDAVVNSRYKQLIHTVSKYAVADPLHANDVDVITPEMAKNFPFGEPGQLLVSFRELGAVGVLDPKTKTMVWATRGPWLGQHDPDILPNGHILLFDNYGQFGTPKSTTRILEFDPATMEIVWQYGGTADHPLGSLIRGSQERLENGNTLITESSAGRILEVTPEGRIVWEYVVPVRDGPAGQPPKLPITCWAQRLDPSSFDPKLLTTELSQVEHKEETQ